MLHNPDTFLKYKKECLSPIDLLPKKMSYNPLRQHTKFLYCPSDDDRILRADEQGKMKKSLSMIYRRFESYSNKFLIKKLNITVQLEKNAVLVNAWTGSKWGLLFLWEGSASLEPFSLRGICGSIVWFSNSLCYIVVVGSKRKS